METAERTDQLIPHLLDFNLFKRSAVERSGFEPIVTRRLFWAETTTYPYDGIHAVRRNRDSPAEDLLANF